jgi:hypothetical protein
MKVWLAERSQHGYASEIFGAFSTPERAREVCQDDANAFFGAARTPPLSWLGSEGYSSASYHHPEAGNYLFQVTGFTVDEKA